MAYNYSSYGYGGKRIKEEYNDEYEEDFESYAPFSRVYDVSTSRIGNSSRALKNKFMSIHTPTSANSIASTARCFHTTVSIHSPIGGDRAMVIQSVLLDTGASGNFLHRDVVNAKGLPTHRLPEGVAFVGAMGQVAVHDEMVQLQCYLGGVPNIIWLYVDDSPVSSRMIVGEPGLDTFLVKHERIGRGINRHAQVTVKPDVTGFRNKGYVVPPDPAHIRPRAYRAGRDDPIVRQLESPMSIPQLHEHMRGQRQRITQKARQAKQGVRSWLYEPEW